MRDSSASLHYSPGCPWLFLVVSIILMVCFSGSQPHLGVRSTKVSGASWLSNCVLLCVYVRMHVLFPLSLKRMALCQSPGR